MNGTRLVAHLAGIGRLAVAFSGGADSALVLAAAVRALGPADVLAVTANSASLAAVELAAAREIAADLGVRHLTPPTGELAEPGYTANGRQRCYFCKTTVLTAIAEVAVDHGFPALATGTNADDAVDPFRPGIRAGDELGVHTPLRTLRLSKEDVRAIARHWGLDWADKPAAPCLASRVRYGVPITTATLARVEQAESAVRAYLDDRSLPSRDVRVRDLGGTARIELDAAVAAEVRDDPRLVDAVRARGFAEAAVAPFRSGGLNHESTAG
ncbi:ATP-dependent sacrificial sulfur transferase LarE [Amycolatopsis rifamycinica]|uniref:ExsB family transcriptional regulator n=1 Tax=Amycolatopsis rifamycinica TaxID=287986 RepID=A0A066UE10_9PSEU|nr:ATP-dependent sacrificial sulfur transferase LarE [Amycolatopsis rifamycinica]KDN22463.1 ExsB family transcriptional regulator [Amycolatopsis rifamycinica]